MSDNSDAIISGCRKAFHHDYIHLSCHFHLGKRLREKTQSKTLKDKKHQIFLGVKGLKNSSSVSFFKNTWIIVKSFWEKCGIEQDFIDCFRKEY